MACRFPTVARGAPPPAQRQRGAATLINAVIILMLMTLIAFFANRGVIFERKTAANQYRSTKALEAAEAGVEWALANLNTASRITTACAATTASGARAFRDVYLDPDADGSYRTVSNAIPVYSPDPTPNPFSTAMPVCTFSGGAWSCSCPTAGTGAAATCSDPNGCPTFRVGFTSVSNDATIARLTVTGCTNGQFPCVGAAGDARADGTARITQVVKVLSGLASTPAAAITAKGNVNFGSNAISATNTDPATNGITINSGGNITGFINDTTINTLPGTPPGASLVGNDNTLATLSDDQMFKTFMGVSKDEFRNASTTTEISCNGVCNSTLSDAISNGARTLWVEGDMTLNANNVYGSPTTPIILVVNGNIALRGTMIIYGVVYCQNTTWDNTGGGDATVYGAVIAEGSFTATGTPNPTYDPNVLRRLRETTGSFAKVPGGWRDF
jgi:Tfp pilus assembly protein PilX